jgi:rod shape-determining protein MreC
MNDNRLSRSSVPGFATIQRNIEKKFLLPTYLLVSFFLLILDSTDFKAIKVVKGLTNDLVTYSVWILKTPIKYPINVIISSVKNINFNAKTIDEQLNDDISKLTSENNQLIFYKNENENLKRILNIRNKEDYSFVYTKIIHENTNEFNKNFTINVGSNEGLQINQAVVRNNVYLGKISELNLYSSKVMVVTDVNSRIPVTIPSRGANAILKGNGMGGADLLFYPLNIKLEDGDQIYTSGTDGSIKEGLYVGKVMGDKDRRFFKNYKIQLGFSDHLLNYVSVLKSKR